MANSTHDADEIILTFTALDTPWANDQVVVLDGGGFYENTYLGGSNLSNTLYTYTADDGSAFINFTTDSYNLDNGDGFTLSYTSIPNPSPYCHTLINPPGNYFDFIEHVQIPTTTLDYYGFFNTAKNAAYAYYPATPPMIGQTGTLYMGTPYSINITSKSASSISCWIDYNQNNVFESNEYTSITSSNIPGVASTGTITIPSSALIGQTGMRIRTRAVGLPNGPNDACTVFSSGETEDYVITISSGIQAPNANFYSSQTNVTINGSVNFYDISTNGPTSWQWIVPGTNIFDPNLPNTGIQFYNSGCYDITLVASNAAGSDTITYTCMILVTGSTYCTGSLHLQNCDSTGFVINDFSIEGTTLNNLNSGCNGSAATPGYSFWPVDSNTSTTIFKDSTYNFLITNTSVGRNSVWIDYNHNGLFESSECTYHSNLTPAYETDTIAITIPVSALTGYTQMRVRAFSGSAGNDPNWACSQFYNFGETEDYRINIQDAIAPTAAFTTPGNVMCAETNINFTNTSINATSYFWTFDGGVPATWVDPNPIVSFSLGGVYLITLTATNAFGTSTFSQNIGINAPVAIAGNDTTICLGTTTQLNASGGITYLWNPPTGLSADNVANPIATPLISTLYSVTVNDGNCTAQENVLITVNAIPTPIISDSSNYLVVDSNLYYLYQWDLNGINISGATFPNVFPNQIGDYTLTVTDNNGCSATSNMINVTVVGVKNLITDNIIIVYPNPASQSFYLRFNPDIEILTIKLLDLAGKILIDKTVSNISKNQLIKFDIDDLSEGIYYLQAKGNENVFTKKIEIIR